MFDLALKLALIPILIPQALMVRRTAQSLPEPPGPRAGRTGAGDPLNVLVLGDSSAAGVGADRQEDALSGQFSTALADTHDLTWRIEAITGATTKSVLHDLPELPRYKVDVAVVVLGVNDVTSQTPLTSLRARRRQLYDTLRREFHADRIIATGIPPLKDFPLLPQPLRGVLGRQATRFDDTLATDATAQGVDYMRFEIPLERHLVATDGFHPSAAAYAIWGRMLADHIRT